MDAIHFLDVRDGGPVAHATARIDAAAALRKACLGGRADGPGLPSANRPYCGKLAEALRLRLSGGA